jgi:hypothetical protein
MKNILEHKKQIVFVLVFLFVTLFVVSLYIKDQRSDLVLQAKLKIAEQETVLTNIAGLARTDSADPVVAAIVQDCELQNRARFDELLGKLSTLRGAELLEVENLFNACGDYFAQQKAMMSARFEREYEVYLDFIDMLKLIDPKADGITYDTDGWKILVDKEKKRSELMVKLVAIQGDIIQAMKKNVSISSEEMQLLLVEGQQTRDALIGLATQPTPTE